MSSLIQSLIDQHPEAFDRLFFIVRLGLFVYIAIGLYPSLRRHLFGGRNVHSSALRPLNSPAPHPISPHTHRMRGVFRVKITVLTPTLLRFSA